MYIGEKKETPYTAKEIIKMALKIMGAREENTYAKGIRAYQTWKDMLLQEKWSNQGLHFTGNFFVFPLL